MTILTEIFEGETIDENNWGELPCPDCGKMPLAIFFDWCKDENKLIIDKTKLTVCHVKKNMAYLHRETDPRDKVLGCGLKCPECGFEPRNSSVLESTGKGVHSDQTTYICPKCDGEDWGHGWAIAWGDKYGH